MTQNHLKTDILTSVETAKHVLSDGLANGLDAVRNEATEIQEMASKGATDIAKTVSQGLKSAGEEKDIILDAAKQQSEALQKLIATELRTHPIRSLGIAAAVGLLAGYMSSR